MLSIAAMMSVASPFRTSSSHGDLHADIARRAFIAEEGDALTLLNVYQAFVGVGQSSAAWASKHALHYATLKRAQAIRTQLAKYVTLHWSLPLASAYDARLLQQCLAAGYFKNAARYQPDGTYRSVEGVTLHVHPTSVLFARKPTSDYVVYADVLHTSQAHMRDVTAVEEAWLRSLAYVCTFLTADHIITRRVYVLVYSSAVPYTFSPSITSLRSAWTCAAPLSPCARNWRKTRNRLVRVVYCPARLRVASGRIVVRSRVAAMWIVCNTCAISRSTSW